MRFTRRRSDRPNLAIGRLGSSLETLESRQLLTGPSGIAFYQPTNLPPRVVLANNATANLNHPVTAGPRQLSFLDNDGKIVTGTDRQGNAWTITVHGPGAVIVTDATPADGMLDDDIDTIQIVDSNINTTFVTGTVVASPRVNTDGVVFFNHLIAQNGVNSIVLNGFTLTQTVLPPTNVPTAQNPAIFLPGGVRVLQFHDIDASIDAAAATPPYVIKIGTDTTPLTVKPAIRLDSIFNIAFDSSLTVNPAVPQTTPTVDILVNGQLQSLDIVSTAASPVPAAEQFAFPLVGVTGRTAVQAIGINKLNVVGAAKNLTVSRQSTPFKNDFSGLDHLGSATFGGNTDAVGLDVQGPIGKLTFLKGQGNPTGDNPAATSLGTPTAEFGYPALGFLGGVVTARSIGSLKVAPANIVLQTSNNPNNVQLYRQGVTTFYPRAGNALSNSVIASAGNIGKTTILGDLQESEIKAGFHYASFVAGLEGTRSASKIAPLSLKGNLVNSVISASFRPNILRQYGVAGDTFGPGTIQGHVSGIAVNTGETTSLNNTGSGVFARHKIGNLPPPQKPLRVKGVLTKP
jgi:hypothetical protein